VRRLWGMIRVLYFLEDRAQASFIKAIVERVAKENNIRINHNVLSASGGSKSFKHFKNFVKDLKRGELIPHFDILIVGCDGNCKGYREKMKEINQVINDSKFKDRVVGCIPDPYIGRWYLLDPLALKRVIKKGINISTPPYKCKGKKGSKGFYKGVLGNILREIGSHLSGPEYGALIAKEMDFSLLESKDKGFKEFISELRRRFRILGDKVLNMGSGISKEVS